MINESDERIAEGIQILTRAIAERELERGALVKQLADLDRQQDGSRQLLRQYEEEQNLRVLNNRTITTDWAKIMEPDPWYGNTELRQELRKLMLGKPGFEWSGIDTQTGGYAFRIEMRREDISPFYMQLIQQAIETILPHIKPYENGLKRIKLMEPSLSQHGSYHVLVYPDGKCILGFGSRYTPRERTNTLAEMLQHIATFYAMHDA